MVVTAKSCLGFLRSLKKYRIYYLTDAMGSVIGLVDENGEQVGSFLYDSFGNLRESEGSLIVVPEAGGDFRFQGQWLESNTDFYNFRARYYDPETGRFISRDPVDIIETEPESGNPYQFVYNNPHVYSDPTGLFTMTELNAADSMRNILEYGRTILIDGAKDFIQEKTNEVIGNYLMAVINQLLPTNPIADAWATVQQGVSRGFEDFIRDRICHPFMSLGQPFVERVWIEPAVQSRNGKPQSNGFNCSLGIVGRPGPNAGVASHPDFIIKDGYPYRSSSGRRRGFKKGNPDSYLIGDLKASTTAALKQINIDHNQWLAISGYASKYQAMPFALYITFMRGFRGETLTDTELAEETVKAQRNALSKHVVLFMLKIYD